MTQLIDNYSQTARRVTPQSVTFTELCLAIYATIRQSAPTFIPTLSIEYRIHDLFNLCPPDLNREGARWLLPIPMQKLAHELAQEVGAQVLHKEG